MDISEVLRYAYIVADALKEDRRVKRLQQIEHRLNHDDTICRLAARVNEASELFTRVYDNQTLVSQAQKSLYEAKLALDSESLVREYYEAFTPVREMYAKLQTKIFDPFNFHVCGEQ